jgi:hypothetical protein
MAQPRQLRTTPARSLSPSRPLLDCRSNHSTTRTAATANWPWPFMAPCTEHARCTHLARGQRNGDSLSGTLPRLADGNRTHTRLFRRAAAAAPSGRWPIAGGACWN